jgi:hypothetical protein
MYLAPMLFDSFVLHLFDEMCLNDEQMVGVMQCEKQIVKPIVMKVQLASMDHDHGNDYG